MFGEPSLGNLCYLMAHAALSSLGPERAAGVAAGGGYATLPCQENECVGIEALLPPLSPCAFFVLWEAKS